MVSQLDKWDQELNRIDMITDQEYYRSLGKSYETMAEEIQIRLKEYIENYDELSYVEKMRGDRLAASIDGLHLAIEDRFGDMMDLDTKHYIVKKAELGYYGSWYAIEGKSNLQLDFAGRDSYYLAELGSFDPDFEQFSERLYTHRKKIADTLMDQIRRDVEGKGLRNVAAQVAELTEANYKQALRIARTEGGRVRSFATQQSYQDAEDAGIKMMKMWVSTLDERTRDTHQQLDGQTIDVFDEFYVKGNTAEGPRLFDIASEDINCRCTTVAVIGDSKEDLDLMRRDHMTGENIENLTYNEWLEQKRNQRPDIGNLTMTERPDEFALPERPGFPKVFNFENMDDAYGFNYLEKGRDKQVVREAQQRALDLANRYPLPYNNELEWTVGNTPHRALGVNKDGIIRYQKGDVYMAKYRKEISFQRDLFDDKEWMTEQIQDGDRGWQAPMLYEDPLEIHVVDHEYGHAIDMAWSRVKSPELTKMRNAFLEEMPFDKRVNSMAELESLKKAAESYNMHVDRYQLSRNMMLEMAENRGMGLAEFNQVVEKELGRYASSSPEEFFAEGFTAWRVVKEPTAFVQEFGQILEREFKEVLLPEIERLNAN